MICQTQGIVLRISPFSRTSHIVTWLTPEDGRLTTSVRGACRPKSPFLGQYDLYYTCELLYYRHEHNGIHTAKESTPISIRKNLRKNWRSSAVASYLSSLVIHISQPRHNDSQLYTYLSHSLDLLSSSAIDPFRILISSELAFLDAAGLTPNISPCPKCPPDHQPTRFCLQSGHLICPHRPPISELPTTLHIPPVVTIALTDLRKTFLIPSRYSSAIPFITRFLGLFLRSQLETPLNARKIALQVLEYNPNQE